MLKNEFNYKLVVKNISLKWKKSHFKVKSPSMILKIKKNKLFNLILIMINMLEIYYH